MRGECTIIEKYICRLLNRGGTIYDIYDLTDAPESGVTILISAQFQVYPIYSISALILNG